jgi:uncharacterized PurR-regulated membrane protein YhhQ (DUF165 family)
MSSSATEAQASLARRAARLTLAALILVLRVAISVIALLAAYVAAFYFQQPVTLLDGLFPATGLMPGYWLTLGHLLIMLAFFAVMLTNRALGPPYALAQVVIAWLTVTGFWFLVAAPVVQAFPGSPLPPPRVLSAFLVALGIAHLVNIVIFDQARGKPWWRAPFFGGLSAALALPLFYWPIAKWGTEPFLGRMAVDMAVKAALVYVLLALYALLRPVIRPRAGLGGY